MVPITLLVYGDDIDNVSEQISSNIERIIDANTAETNHIHTNKPLKLEYGISEVTSDLSSSGGGLEWSKNTINGILDEDYEGEALDKLKNELEENLEDITTSSQSIECSSRSQDIEIQVSNRYSLAGTMHTGKVVTSCPGIEIVKNDVKTEFDSSNSYLYLVRKTVIALNRFNSELEDTEPSFKGEGEYCDSETEARDKAKQESLNNAENTIENKYSSAINGLTSRSGIRDISGSLVEVTGDKDIESVEKSKCNVEPCEGEDCETCTEDGEEFSCRYDNKYEAEAVMTVENVETDIDLAGEDEILYNGEWTNLEFSVDSYIYSFN